MRRRIWQQQYALVRLRRGDMGRCFDGASRPQPRDSRLARAEKIQWRCALRHRTRARAARLTSTRLGLAPQHNPVECTIDCSSTDTTSGTDHTQESTDGVPTAGQMISLINVVRPHPPAATSSCCHDCCRRNSLVVALVFGRAQRTRLPCTTTMHPSAGVTGRLHAPGPSSSSGLRR